MPTLYRDTGYTLTHLVEEIRHGNIALPDIQRPFVWKAAKVRDLFDSMYRGYPIGTLMLWETGASVGTRQVGGGESDRVARLLIVDGQQRLTSLYAVMTGSKVLTKSFRDVRIRIAFRPTTETFEVTDAAIEKDPEFIPDITALWAGGYKSAVREFMHRHEEATGLSLTNDEKDALEERIDRVRDLPDFRFQVIELGMGSDEEQVAEIFVRTNSEGVKLNQADFILTLMSVHWEAGRQQLEAFSRAAVDPTVTGRSPRNAFLDPSPDQMLRVGVGLAFRRGRLQHVYSLLRGKDLESGQVSEEARQTQFDRLRVAQDAALDLTNWHEFLKVVSQAGFRNSKMITSNNAILYTYILWLIGRNDFNLSISDLRPVIARWFFMVQTTGRYTSSPESAIESDLNRLRGVEDGDGAGFIATLDRQVAASFTGDYWTITLPIRLDTAASRSPALFAYWAALNLLDAELLFSNMRIRDLVDAGSAAPRAVERHHLFPKAFLAQQGITDTYRANAIANMAFLDWPENASIAAQDPQAYWPQYRSQLPIDQAKRHSYWHALPVGWEQMDYDAFLARRRELMAAVVRDGFDTLWARNDQRPTELPIEEMMSAGESQWLEFKSTARWNTKSQQVDKRMEQVVVKTVAGFLNSEGGTLLIGVDDQGQTLGLAHDLATLKQKPDLDGYELFLRQLLESNLSVPTAATVRVDFAQVNAFDVARISVSPSGKPVFAKQPDGGAFGDFWVRMGNATTKLHGDDLVQYQQDHWG